MTPVIRISSLSKDYIVNREIFHALVDVDLEVMEKDIYGIIGLSGAGKSTLIRCMNLLEKPNSGTIEVNLFDEGLDLLFDGRKATNGLNKYRRKMGMIFQNFNLFEQRNVLKNVMYPLEISGVKRKAAVERATNLLELVGLSDKLHSYPSQLSGGQKQRVAIARALANDPKILLCDEPTSALDPNTTIQILELLKEINERLGITIIIITHEMKIIEQICNKVSIIDNSRIVESGYVKDIFKNPKSQIARQLIIPVESLKINPDTDKKYLRLVFDGMVDEPIISNLILSCNCQLSILSSSVRIYEDKAYGQMIIQVPSEEAVYKDIINFFNKKEIQIEEVDDSGLDTNIRID